MKNLNSKQTMKCDIVEDLLIKQSFEKLSSNEDDMLKNHIKNCIHCQEFQNQLISIQSSMMMYQKSQLKPDPAIHQNLMKRINVLKPMKHRTVDSAWKRLVNLLDYRIPVYQVLIGLAFSLFIFFVINFFSFANRHQSLNPEFSITSADTLSYQINVIKNLKIIEQRKIGKNVSEDTLLIRFIVSSM